MAKKRTTLSIDEEILRAVKVRAARTGKGMSEIIEEAVRKDLGLDLMQRLWAQNRMTEREAMMLATEGQEAIREEAQYGPAPRPPRQSDPALITPLEGGKGSDRDDANAHEPTKG